MGAIESCRGFLVVVGTLDLPSGEGGVLCGGGLLVEKMNSVDPFFFLFFNQNSRTFFF